MSFRFLYFKKVIGDSSFVIALIERVPEFHCIDLYFAINGILAKNN
jgi:hypothetical protein